MKVFTDYDAVCEAAKLLGFESVYIGYSISKEIGIKSMVDAKDIKISVLCTELISPEQL